LTNKRRRFDTMADQISANGDTGKRLVVRMHLDGAVTARLPPWIMYIDFCMMKS
jgi:hypothetical protein